MLKVYNTLTKQKEEFVPLNPPFVGMYVCGPTVYDDPHLGHAKSYVSFDVIFRFLRILNYKVRYVQNITDVGHLMGDSDEGEDKIIQKARVEQLEPVEIAQKYERRYFAAMDRMNVLRPDISSRATGFILDMIELVKTLIQKGFAYETGGNVYFDVGAFEGYGKLSRRKMEDLKQGTRIDVASDKRNPADFALWKKADSKHIMRWPSPWGPGYPGWHLECSVMSMKFLGDTVDIHGGGIDNQFPHHECEIAQSEAATGKQFVRYWLHNNMVTVDGQKMSKSLGNFITLNDLFAEFDPMVVRFFILQGHYRSPQDFSKQALESAKRGFNRLARGAGMLESLISVEKKPENLTGPGFRGSTKELHDRFFGFMEDDFNTAGAVSVLFEIIAASNKMDETDPGLAELGRLFFFLASDILGLVFTGQEGDAAETEDSLLAIFLKLRSGARENKDWKTADLIRDELDNAGYEIRDSKEGTTWVKKVK